VAIGFLILAFDVYQGDPKLKIKGVSNIRKKKEDKESRKNVHQKRVKKN
jgi:hypothetical protein